MSTNSKSRRGEAPLPPTPLAVPVPDSHTHLDIVTTWDEGDGAHIDVADPAVTAELDAAQAVGIDRIMQVGVDVPSSAWAADLADADPRVLAAVALHPNDAPRLSDLDDALAQIEKLAQRPRVAALGETGLDHFRTDDTGRPAQRRSFREHIGLAKTYRKALMIHDRDAHDDVLAILDEEGAPDTVVMHCFSGDAVLAAECARRGYYLSFAGNVTFKNAPNLREAAAVCPPELMLVETDAPFMTPVPYRGRRNGPFLIPVTLRFLAEHLDRDLDTLCATISDNAHRAFGTW